MSGSLKKGIQERIHQKNLVSYEANVSLQKDAFASFLARNDRGMNGREPIEVPKGTMTENDGLVIPFSCFNKELFLNGSTTSFYLFVNDCGWIARDAMTILKRIFDEQDCDVIYANEDCREEDGNRHTPWFKPQWSPDTLLSYFYFGNMVAIRRRAIENITINEAFNGLPGLYSLLLELCNKKAPILCEDILFHAKNYIQMPGNEAEYDTLKIHFLERKGIKAKYIQGEDQSRYPVFSVQQEKISILIPSKDHPDVLYRCIQSIKELSTYHNYEILVIDNGSSPTNREKYETISKEKSFKYLYQSMDFNFSKMCNIAAKEATGSYYLFLNDDVEILIRDWLERLLGTAALSHAGAVGAKLLFPQSKLIQHVGITNMYQGPAHKLLKMSDEICYDHGRNRGIRDVIGVTAACLLVKKDKFLQIGGFPEELAVAYNDVDLNFRLHKAGYFNIIRNDVVLYHYESLSRGDDGADEKKRIRLSREGEILYGRNPEYYDFDPFYSRELTGVSERYECCLPYENRNLQPCTRINRIKPKLDRKKINETLIIHVDQAAKEKFALQGQKKCYLIDLHAHVRGLDSSDYEYRMYLYGETGCFEVPAVRRYRPDAIRTHHEQIHVELSGFAVRIPEGLLPKGSYEIWMEAHCIFSRQILLNLAKERLIVE